MGRTTWRRQMGLGMVVLLIAALGGLQSAAPARAATLTVDTVQDLAAPGCAPSPCSLRQALARASAGDTIQFSVAGVIPLQHGQLNVNQNVTIQGPGPNVLAIDGRNASRVFEINFNVTSATIAGLTIQGGAASGNDNRGGGIENQQGTLNVANVVFDGNRATGFGEGGAISNSAGTMTISNSTFIGNTAGSLGGAIMNDGLLTISNSTFRRNT